jgi:hypothetical protein
MPDAPPPDQPERPSVCLAGTAVLDRLRSQFGPDAVRDRSVGRAQLDRLEGADKLGDVVRAVAGEVAEPYTLYLNAQPARLQSDLLTLVRAAVAEGTGVEIELELRRTGRPGAQVTTWYDDEGSHRAIVVFLPPPS